MKLIDRESLTEHMRKAYEGNTKAGFKWDLECTVAVIYAEDEYGDRLIPPDGEIASEPTAVKTTDPKAIEWAKRSDTSGMSDVHRTVLR